MQSHEVQPLTELEESLLAMPGLEVMLIRLSRMV